MVDGRSLVLIGGYVVGHKMQLVEVPQRKVVSSSHGPFCDEEFSQFVLGHTLPLNYYVLGTGSAVFSIPTISAVGLPGTPRL